jgi:hypothetical protein
MKWLTASLMVGGFGWYCFAGSPNESRYTRIASSLAGHDVRVHCEGRLRWTLARWGHGQLQAGERGFAEVGGLHAYLSPRTCRELDRLIASPTLPLGEENRLKAEEALLVLAHEAMHLQGVESEATANCKAGQAVADVAEELGFTADRAAALQTFTQSDLRLNSFNQPPWYQVDATCFS